MMRGLKHFSMMFIIVHFDCRFVSLLVAHFCIFIDLNVLFLFVITAAGVVPCGGHKKSTAHIYSADYILLLVI